MGLEEVLAWPASLVLAREWGYEEAQDFQSGL